MRNGQKIVGIGLGLLGTLLLVGPSILLNVGANLWGQLAVIGAALSFSVTAIYVRVIFQKKSKSPLDSALETLISQLFIATIVLLPFAWIIDQFGHCNQV
jgi:drug/metabolite transporter (DMT)-like permease